MRFHEQFMNIHEHQHELILWTSWTQFICVAGLPGSLLNHLISWSFMSNLNFMNMAWELFHERLICCSGTFVNSSWTHLMNVHECSLTIYGSWIIWVYGRSWTSWTFHDFHECLICCSGTFMNSSWTHLMNVHECSLTIWFINLLCTWSFMN